MNIINLTPHSLNIINNNNETVTIAPTGKIARVTSKTEIVDTINDINIMKQTFGEVIDLPEPIENTIFVVSRMVKDRVPNRNDVLVPGIPVRDDKGNIIGANGLSL